MIRNPAYENYINVKLSKILIDELKSHCCKNGYQTLQNCLEDIIIKIIIAKYEF